MTLNRPIDSSTLSERSEVEETQREYYNRIADEYEEHYGSSESLQYREWLFDRLLSGIDLKGLRVLDFMCGGGENSAFFKKKGAIVSGIDISERQCEFYKKRFPGAEVICGSALNSSWDNSTFDLVVVESLHHLHPNVSQGLIEMTRVLKPGGYLVIWEPSAGSVLDLARKLWYRVDIKYFQKNEASVDFESLLNQLSNSFHTLSFRYGGNLAYLFVMSSMHFRIPTNWVRYYSKLFMRLELLIERFQGKLLAIWGLVLLRKK